MKVTRVIFKQHTDRDKSLAECSIILDDCLKLSNIKLFKNENGFYLVLPSKQDVYQSIDELNPSKVIVYPEKSEGSKKFYEEFYNPVDSNFYKLLLSAVSAGYRLYKTNGVRSYRP